jgi:hypothetical protein
VAGVLLVFLSETLCGWQVYCVRLWRKKDDAVFVCWLSLSANRKGKKVVTHIGPPNSSKIFLWKHKTILLLETF